MNFTSDDVDRLAAGHQSLEELLKPSLIQARQRVTQMEYFPKMGYYNLFRHDYYDEAPLFLEHLTLDEARRRIHPDYLEGWNQSFEELDKCIHDSIKFHTVMKCWETNEYRVKAVALFARYNEKGELDHYVGTTCDLTHEVFERQHLLKYKQKSEILNNRYKMALWSYDPKTRVVHSDNNGNDYVFHDYTQEEFLALTHPDYLPQIKHVFQDMDNYRFKLDCVVNYMRHPDGSYHYYQIIPERLTNHSGDVVTYLFISHDVTDEKVREFRMNTFAEHVHQMTVESGIRLYVYEPGSRHLHVEDPLGDPNLKKLEVKDFIPYFSEDLRPAVLEVFDQCDARSLGRREWTVRWKPADDVVSHLYRVVVLPVLDEKGRIKEYGFMRIDITKENLQQEMLSFTQSVGKIAAWTYDIESSRSEWTEELYRILGMDPQSDYHMTYPEYLLYIVPEDRERVKQRFHEAIYEQEDFTMDYDLRALNGEIKHVEHNLHVRFNKQGKPLALFGTLMDITERTRLIEEKEQSDQLLSVVLKGLPILVNIKDIDAGFRIVMSNDVHARFYGKTSEEMIGLSSLDYLPASIREAQSVSDQEAAKRSLENPWQEVLSIPDVNGRIHYFQNMKFPITLKGKRLLIGVCSDVTELQKAKETAESNDRLKSAFLANMSHEIRTPLNAIVGFSDLIVENISPEDNAQFIDLIKSNSDHLLRLIGDILDLSKMEANVMQFVFSRFNVNDMMKEAAMGLQGRFEKKGVVLKYEPVEKLCLVYQDKVRVTEVLNNFLTNALKNTECGSVTQWLEWKPGRFKICVQDTGVGIPQDKLNVIFERFEKLDSFKEGTGLGLSVCKAIVEHLGGQIGVESQVGKGSLFWAEFPIDGKEYI